MDGIPARIGQLAYPGSGTKGPRDCAVCMLAAANVHLTCQHQSRQVIRARLQIRRALIANFIFNRGQTLDATLAGCGMNILSVLSAFS